MSSNDFKINVEELEGPDDWAEWKWQIEMLFRTHDLEPVVAEDAREPTVSDPATEAELKARKRWLKDDAKAASMISAALGKSIGELVLACSSAKGI